MKCLNCGEKACHEARENHRYVVSGLTNVELLDVPVRRCTKCGDTEVIIDRLPELHRAIAHVLVRKHSALAAEEFRFLRKHLGLSSTDLARKIGVTLESISRWESGRMAIHPAAERLLRLMVATSHPVDRYPEEIFPTRGPTKNPRPARVRVCAPSKTSRQWATAA